MQTDCAARSYQWVLRRLGVPNSDILPFEAAPGCQRETISLNRALAYCTRHQGTLVPGYALVPVKGNEAVRAVPGYFCAFSDAAKAKLIGARGDTSDRGVFVECQTLLAFKMRSAPLPAPRVFYPENSSTC